MIALLHTLVLAVNAQDERAHSAHAGSDGDGEVCDPGSETTQWWTARIVSQSVNRSIHVPSIHIRGRQ
jgi:hypothetical protein